MIEPSIQVSTGLKDEWVDLEPNMTQEEFTLAALHKLGASAGETCDSQGIPEFLVKNGPLPELWEYAKLSKEQQQIVYVYSSEIVGGHYRFEFKEAMDSFLGKFESKEAFIKQWWQESGQLETISDKLMDYLDWSKIVEEEDKRFHIADTRHGVFVFSKD
jgi:antirestriction protein